MLRWAARRQRAGALGGALGLGLLTAPTWGWGGAAALALVLVGLAWWVPIRRSPYDAPRSGDPVELWVEGSWLHLRVGGQLWWSRPRAAAQVRYLRDHRALWFGSDEVLAVPDSVPQVAILDQAPAEPDEGSDRTVLRWTDPHHGPVLLVLSPRGFSYWVGARRGRLAWTDLMLVRSAGGARSFRAPGLILTPPPPSVPIGVFDLVDRWKAQADPRDRGPYAAPAA